MHLDIPHIAQKMVIYETGKYRYRSTGVSLYMNFIDLNKDVPQCEIRSVEGDNAISGGTNVSFDSTTEREWGKNLLFEPIPLEMLAAPATKPQVAVKIYGIDGVCPDLNCDYVYTTPPSEVTVQTLAANLLDISIEGTALPTDGVRVVLGNAECGTVTATETAITCSLSHQPAAGSWDVQVIDANGLAPIADGVAKIDVALTVSSISPSSDLNQLGGDVITITGAGFDEDTTATTVTFSEDSTACDVESATPTELKCKISGFDKTRIDNGESADYTVAVTVNSVENT